VIARAIAVSVQGCLGGRRAWWLVVGLVALWLFSAHLYNPWDGLLSATEQNPVVFIAIPLYLLVTNVDLLRPWEAMVVVRLGTANLWWWAHVFALGLVAVVMSLGLAVLSGVVAVVSGHWSWEWGAFGRHSAYPAVLAQAPWTIPWHWSLDALTYLALGLWAVGVLRHVLALWWRGPWIPWLMTVALGFASKALSNTLAQGAVWWLPGSQFSFYYHWTPTGSRTLGWTLLYATCLILVATTMGLVFAQRPRWQSLHGEGP